MKKLLTVAALAAFALQFSLLRAADEKDAADDNAAMDDITAEDDSLTAKVDSPTKNVALWPAFMSNRPMSLITATPLCSIISL